MHATAAIFSAAFPAALLVASVAAAQETDHRSMIEDAHTQFEQATVEQDYDRLAEMFAPDGLYMPADGVVLKGRDEIRNYMDEQRFTVSNIEQARYEEVGDDVLVDIGTFSLNYPEDRGGHVLEGEYVAVVEPADDRVEIQVLVAFPPREAQTAH